MPAAQLVLDLVRHCDVLLENFRPGTLEKWGLGPQELEEINPNLVIIRISAFGQTGPLSQRPGFAAVAEAAGGMRELVGEPDRPPSRVGVSIGDSIAGIYAAFGAVMALFQRERERKNVPSQQRIVDVALNESILSVMESLVPDYLAYGVETRTCRRPNGGHRTEQCLPVQRRDQHHHRRQRRLDIPALHADHRQAGPGCGPGPAEQRRAVAATRRTRRRDRRMDHSAHPRAGLEVAR